MTIEEIHPNEEMKRVFRELYGLSSEAKRNLFTLWNKTSTPGVYVANLDAVLRKDNDVRLSRMIFKAYDMSQKIMEALGELDFFATEPSFTKREANKEVRRRLMGV